jgi:hypothetical protein
MTILRLLVLLCAALVPAVAQEGHPLSGTWSGERTLGAGKTIRTTLVMEWDGKAVTGAINPGPDALPLERVTVDYDKWTVRIEARGTVIEGALDELGSWHRTLMGTWKDGTATGTFKLTRD